MVSSFFNKSEFQFILMKAFPFGSPRQVTGEIPAEREEIAYRKILDFEDIVPVEKYNSLFSRVVNEGNNMDRQSD